MKEVKDITLEELKFVVNLATNGYSNSEYSKDLKEEEVGGYGKRRRLTWVQNTEGYDEYNYFEISSEYSSGWSFHCKVGTELDSVTNKPKYEHMIILCNTHKIVDYCRKHNFNIENKELV